MTVPTRTLSALVFALVAITATLGAVAQDRTHPITLANDEWPPFILPYGQTGKAHELVCEALQRSGYGCRLEVEDWSKVLEMAQSGEVDGIAAAWRNAEREEYLLFSESYLTNRIVPVVGADFEGAIESPADLAGLRVALVSGYAYGDEIRAAADSFETIASKGDAESLEHVREGRADVALVDELEARERLDADETDGELVTLPAVLAYRSLHLAIGRHHPNAEQIIADFQAAYRAMLLDGTVNEIIEVDWLATDFGQAGTVSVVMRNGVSLDDLAIPTDSGSMYALEQSEYEWMQGRTVNTTEVNFKVQGETYNSMEAALDNAFGRDSLCQHNAYSSTFDCTRIFKKN